MRTEPKLRALVIGAHPDDCEFSAGGLAAKLVAGGHAVKFVSVTDGSAGHHEIGGGPLAKRRLEETRAVAAVAGVEYEVLDYPDGRLEVDLAARERMIRIIRAFRPDLVFTHRPNDYHPDHRRTSTLVQDASYLIRVPNIAPLVPHLSETPVILYLRDGFQKPYPFQADVAVATDDVLDAKARMLHCHASQVYEWLPYDGGYLAEVPPAADESARLAWLTGRVARRDAWFADRHRDALVARYGEERGRAVRGAEVFEVSEYGRPLPPEQVADYFPE
jgi:LmbE family N-acetylglucosaminyl deacetylase